MDFLSSYFPLSPTAATPKANPTTFEDLPSARPPSDAKQLDKLRSGDFHELRQLRQNGEKRTSKVKFMAPTVEDSHSLKSVKLTPKAGLQTPDSLRSLNMKGNVHDRSAGKLDKEKKKSIFGLFRRNSHGSSTRPKTSHRYTE